MKRAALIVGGILVAMLGTIFKSANADNPRYAGMIMLGIGCIMVYMGIFGSKKNEPPKNDEINKPN